MHTFVFQIWQLDEAPCDTAKKLYHGKLLTAENKRMIPLSVESITFDSSNFDEVPPLEMGWGLPTARAPIRYTIKQKQFLQEKFNDGLVNGRFWKPETVAKAMQQLKADNGKYVFAPNEWLTTSQIRSYFSRMKKNQTQTTEQSFSITRAIPTFLELEGDNEEDIDEESYAEEFFKDDTAIQEAVERDTFLKEASRST
ncbi:unnamed protein product [Adineta ricciae]|uniref:Uncharacterized protein n=1 Tax=Adineta ricciae TaxID=249248 RepID=A0A816HG63_ADIRI|nr:unnamed protein product [Adineta ricciae]